MCSLDSLSFDRVITRLLITRCVIIGFTYSGFVAAESTPQYATQGMVVCQSRIASEAGVQVLKEGGTAIDAAVTTAFVMAVTHPSAGNIGGGGFIVYRPQKGSPTTFDFREKAPAAAHPKMWLDSNGKYDRQRHHYSHQAVGVPGTVAGLHLVWSKHGRLPWKRLVEPAVRIASDGFPISHGLAMDLERVLPRFRKYPASLAQFSNNGEPLQPGMLLVQKDLAETLKRIADQGPDGFYKGMTAKLIAEEMSANNGHITEADLEEYRAIERNPMIGTYRGYDIIGMPPPSSGGVTLIQMLNILERYDIRKSGFGSAKTLHLMSEAMRRAYRNRALHLGDPDFNSRMPINKLTSKGYALEMSQTVSMKSASKSDGDGFEWPEESSETTHLSVVDKDRNAVSLTYTLENSYGSAIVVTGGGFLLNNEMGDFNPAPGLTTDSGLIGSKPNLTQPGKRMLSSMSPTIVAIDNELFLVTGSPGGRTIINTVLQTILNTIDHKMDPQLAVNSGRIHHQWFPDRIQYEELRFSPDSLELLEQYGHELKKIDRQGSAHIILYDQKTNLLQGGYDLRRPDSAAVGY